MTIIEGKYIYANGIGVNKYYWQVPKELEGRFNDSNMNNAIIIAPDMEGILHVVVVTNKNVSSSSIPKNAFLLGNIISVIKTENKDPIDMLSFVANFPSEVILQGVSNIAAQHREVDYD